jgi:hypothetical protein
MILAFLFTQRYDGTTEIPLQEIQVWKLNLQLLRQLYAKWIATIFRFAKNLIVSSSILNICKMRYSLLHELIVFAKLFMAEFCAAVLPESA